MQEEHLMLIFGACLIVWLSVVIWRQAKDVLKIRTGNAAADRFLDGTRTVREYRGKLDMSDPVSAERSGILGDLSVLAGRIARNWESLDAETADLVADRMSTVGDLVADWEANEIAPRPDGHVTLSEAAAALRLVSDDIRAASAG